MGASASSDDFEIPNKATVATLYYFAGRGLADQIRWMLAATRISYTTQVITTNSRFKSMAKVQLPLGQLPLLQIDNLEIVQSQACVRYLAKRGKINGSTPQEEVKCDMIAESCRDLIGLCTAAPFIRYNNDVKKEFAQHIAKMKEVWKKNSSRYEIILKSNGGEYLVGKELSYADVLVAHALTWFVEECGPEIVIATPLLVGLQNKVVNLPGVRAFIRSTSYYPPGDDAYVHACQDVLGRKMV
mmetsp:Transcript_22009/g.21268  ORF Transcript_22009/g.21268 Transcript_22009/m.21268 type:complete len:243 (+) Transcript_22009:87-815(+)